MAWAFSNIKYGWKIGAGIVLAGATIFIVNNQRQRVNHADVIEIVLGTYERCLATQYATNPLYRVTPPDFVITWYSNNAGVLYSNTFTNAIGWRTDRAMMVELDTKIKALVPYYVDTNTVYDGSPNINMLTVTGLFAALQIGDLKLPWQIYAADLEERYKVAWYLQKTLHTPQRYDLDLYQGAGKVWMFEVVDGDTPGTYRCTNYAILPADANDAAYLAAVADYKLVSNGVMAEVPFRQVSSNRYYYHEGLYPTNVSIQTNLLVTITGHQFYCLGGDVTTSGAYRVHTFTNTGATSLTVVGTGLVDVLIVAGGGGGGTPAAYYAGGGGGGDVVYHTNYSVTQSLDVVVGTGGACGAYLSSGQNGSNSTFGVLVAYGGGGGAGVGDGSDGGSGGGGSAWFKSHGVGGAATGTLGYAGGDGVNTVAAGGGGGAGSIGSNAVGATGGNGGAGWESAFSGGTVSYSPGGAGAGSDGSGTPGTGYYGAGGGGGGPCSIGDPPTGTNGNPGIVIVRYVPVSGLDPSGLYTFAGYTNGPLSPPTTNPHPYWTGSGDWVVMWNGNLDTTTVVDARYFVSQNVLTNRTSIYWTPSWYMDPGPIGLSVGTFNNASEPYALGTVSNSYVLAYTTNIGLLTNAYVEYKLEKMGGDFNVYLSTNIEHRVEGAFAYTEAPTFADHNYYNDWTLGLIEDAWNNLGNNSWSFSSTNLVAIGGDLTVPPDEVTWEATVQNESGAEGFCINENLKAVGDWHFLYCTNKYW